MIPASTRVINILRMLYPGKWTCKGSRYWQGPEFRVRKKNNVYYREDTGEPIKFPKRKKRNHYISNICQDLFGGKWVRKGNPPTWHSDDHPFEIQTTVVAHIAYKRSDTGEIIYVGNGVKSYR